MQNQIPAQQESSGNATLEFTNGAFLGEGFQIKPAFQDVVTKEFLATVQNVQFGDPPAAAKVINSWVAGHTHDKIHDLVSPGKEI
jgi:serine protease inhibitor